MILADSGFWIALCNRRDRYHGFAAFTLERGSDEGFISTWPVLTEVTHLLNARIGVRQTHRFYRCCGARCLHGGAIIRWGADAHGLFDAPLQQPADGFGRCLAGVVGRTARRGPHFVYRQALFFRLSLEKYPSLYQSAAARHGLTRGQSTLRHLCLLQIGRAELSVQGGWPRIWHRRY